MNSPFRFPSLKRIALLLVVGAATPAQAAPPAAGTCEIKVVDGASGSVRTYYPGSQPSEFPLTGVRGWTRCRMSQLKQMKLDGRDGVGVDLSCFGATGEAMSASSAAPQHPGSVFDIAMVKLLASAETSPGGERPDAGAFKEITVSCAAPARPERTPLRLD